MGLREAPQAEAPAGPRMPDTTVSPFYAEGEDPADEAAAADPAAPVPGAIDYNPARTAAALHAHLTTMGADPAITALYQRRVQAALSQPAPTAEQLTIGVGEAHAALVDQYGEDADAIGELARREVSLLAAQHPQIIDILERTGLGNDVHLIKSLASRGYNRLLTARGYKVD
jgi:hypothetical protein